jgi:alpha-pyrone synthase
MHTVLESIATANPPFEISQAQSLAFVARMEGLSPSLRDRAAKIYANSSIDRRYTCIPDYLTEPANFTFYPPNWQLEPSPSTADRNQRYTIYAAKITESAAQQAIQQAQLEPTEVTHLIVVSCTGFSAPGLDIHLMQQLGLRSDIDRTLIGFMGCNAAFNGLKTAHAICQSHSQARVLLVCVELCTLHFQAENTLESVVINAIFGDGAAAAVLSSRSTPDAIGKLAYLDGYSTLAADTLDLMRWTIGNTGFLMHLSPKVPQAIVQHLPGYLTTFLERHQLERSDLDFWAIHPGGRQIVDQIKSLFELDAAMVQDSYDVLRQYGNMSSCTILFILQRLLVQHQAGVTAGGGLEMGLALAFGPGLTIEGCLFQQVH